MKCVKCKSEAVDGKKRCQYHLDKHNIYSRNWQKKQRAMGNCARCGEPSDAELCAKCRANKYQSNLKWRGKMVCKARCIECGKVAVKGRRRCQSCINKRKEIDKKYVLRLVKEKRCKQCTRKLDDFSLIQNKRTCMVCRQGRRR